MLETRCQISAMNNKIDIKKAGFYYLIGTLFNKGIAFITVPIFTRILSTEDYGIVTTYNSWVAIASMVTSLALYAAIRTGFVDYESKVNDVLSALTNFILLYGSCMTLFVLIGVYILPFSVDIALVAFCMVQSVAYGIVENLSMYFMMKYRYKIRTVILVLPNLLSTIIAVLLINFVLQEKLYFGRIVPNASINLLFGIYALIYIFKHSRIRFSKEYLEYGLKISIPLVLHGISLNILSQSDRAMITMLRDASETGIYGLIYNFSMIATVFTTALDGIWVPYFTEKMKVGDYDGLNSFSKKYIKLMALIILGVILLAPEIVKLMAPVVYWEGIRIIPPIVLSNYIIFLYTLYVNIEYYHKKTFFIMINTSIAALSNIILNLIFIKLFGYVGAAYTTILSYLISLGLHYAYARKLNNKLFTGKTVILPSLCLAAIVVVFYIFIDKWTVRWGIAALCTIYMLLAEKEFILNIVRRR